MMSVKTPRRIRPLKQGHGTMTSELLRLQTENIQLLDANSRLNSKLSTFGTLADSKSNLSAQLLMTEEEKLMVSKALVDMQVENNLLQEEVEATKFEMANRILQLENRVMEIKTDRDRHRSAAKNLREKLQDVDREKKDLADEYVVLKSTHVNVEKEYKKALECNEELSIEFLNVVTSKADLMRRWKERDMSFEAGQEVERAKALVNRLNARTRDDILASAKERSIVEESLFSNQRRFESEVERMRHQYEDEQRNIESRMSTTHTELNTARNLARERQKKLAEMNAQMITMRDTNNILQSENNRMQHKLKEINEDFRARLIQYVRDVAHYIDTGGLPDKKRDQAAMKKYVEEMLKDLKRSYKLREEQLADAATKYKQRSDDVVRRHEVLLVSYRELRMMLENHGHTASDLGPDETQLQFADSNLVSEQQKEVNRLRTQLNQTTQELENAKIRLRTGGGGRPSTAASDSATNAAEWTHLRRHLREFTMNTQQDLERERAGLMSKNVVLEEQNKELSEYIDNHLMRYKEEIIRLRGMLGITESSSGFKSPPHRRKNKHRK